MPSGLPWDASEVLVFCNLDDRVYQAFKSFLMNINTLLQYSYLQ